MSLIAALICDPANRQHLRSSLCGRGQLEFCSRSAELMQIVLRRPADAIVTELRDSAGDALAPTIRRLHSQFSAIPIVAWCSVTPGISAELLDLMHAGISAIAFRGLDDMGQALQSALGCGDDRAVCATVTAAAVEAAGSAEGRMFISYCIENARAPPTVAEMAAALGVHRKTLVNWMHRARLPPPQQIMGWCRMLLAARLLEDAARSVESVALELGFGSASEFRNMLRRYTALRPREIRGRAGFERVLALFAHEATSPEVTPFVEAAKLVSIPSQELSIPRRETV